MLDVFRLTETERQIEWDTGERGHQFELTEARIERGGLACLHEQRADAAPSKRGGDEEGANACGVGAWVEERILGRFVLIAAEERAAFAPSAAAADYRRGLGDEVRAVGDECGVNTEDVLNGGFDDGFGVEGGAECADGFGDERAEGREVGGSGEAGAHVSPAPVAR